MLSAVWISCALVIVALAICSATVVATPKSTSAGVALNTLHPPYAPVVIKRRLKRTTAIEDTETFEERTPTFLNSEMEPFLDKLKSISAGIGKQLTRDVTSFPQTFSDNEFQLLNLDKLAKNEKLFNPNDLKPEEFSLFKDPRFQKWVTYVQGRYSETSPTVPYEEVMLKTLEQNYLGNGCALTRQFAAGTMLPQSESLAFKLLDMQLSTWLRSDVSVSMKELITALELNGLNAKLFENPRFLLWLQFFKSRYEKAIEKGNEVAFELAKAADDLAKSTFEVAEEHNLSLKLPEYPFNMIDGEAEKAKKAFEMATFLFLYKDLNFYVMDSATIEGSKVDNAKAKYIAVKLQHMLIGRGKWDLNKIPKLLKLTNEVSKPMSRS